MIVLVLGGARSGKSALAERCATRLAVSAGDEVTYLATGVATDASFASRIEAHRARRPTAWATLEVGAELTPALAAATGTVLVDSLGTWLAAHEGRDADPAPLLRALTGRRAEGRATVLVSDEVGMGVHPATEVGRRFRDALGALNHAAAAVADRVLLAVAGRAIVLHPAADQDLEALLGIDGRER